MAGGRTGTVERTRSPISQSRGRRTRGPRLARDGYQFYREATAFLRPLPDYLIIGAQRSGTTSLHDQLATHPAIGAARAKEVHYFDLNHDRGDTWYRSHFPTTVLTSLRARRVHSAPVYGEASPYYLYHPEAPGRAHRLLPDAKLVAVLRDPVTRALSHYHHEFAKGTETLSFEDALDAEPQRLSGRNGDPSTEAHQRFSYVARGRYAEQLARWLDHYPHDQLLIVFSEDLFGSPQAELARIFAHLGVPAPRQASRLPHENRRGYASMSPHAERRLREAFREPNGALAELAGRTPPWPD